MVILCEKKENLSNQWQRLILEGCIQNPIRKYRLFRIACDFMHAMVLNRTSKNISNCLKIVKDSKKFRLRSLTNKLFGVSDKNHTEISNRVASDDKVAGTSLAVYQNRTKYEPG